MNREADEPSSADQPYRTPEDEFSEHPRQIGPYRILQVLGEGGMGVVYEAEQTIPMTRRVALKVIKLGMDTKQVLARFEAECQALAVMDHRGIAKVYEAGETESGRPYIAMERVPGVPITEYCDNSKLSTEERLELFVPLCQAIQHAHQKGIIHRDLKPSNILVTEQDGKPVPKVIDFGIAKAVGRRLTDRTLVTEFGQAMGTAAYMSPEQAEMSGLDVDTRADIYSLGVILYELLVGEVPIDPHSVGIPGFIAQLVLRETDPPTPSARISSLGKDRDFVAKQRHTDPSALYRELRGDLDWITMKALESDRSRRYETANELAADIGRHLRDEPVLARKPSAAYRARKFVSRHTVGVAFTGALFLLLAVSSLVLAVSLNRAVRAEARARLEAEKSNAINEFLQRMLASANPRIGARDVKVVDLLDAGAEEIEETFGAQPGIEAAVRLTLGRTYQGLGLVDEAETQLRQSLDVRRSAQPQNPLEVAESLNQLGVLMLYKGEYQAADSLFVEALGIRRSELGPEHVDVAESMQNLGASRSYMGEYDSADSLYRAALEMRRRLLGERHLDVAGSQSNLATLLSYRGEFEEAESLLRAALVTRRELQGDHVDVATVMNNLAIQLQRLEKYEEAERLLRESLEIKRRLLGDEHPDVANSMNNLGVYLRRIGDYAAAEPLIRDALEINRSLFGDTNPEVSTNLTNLALLLEEQGRLGEAESLFRQSLAIDRAVHGNDHPEVAVRLNNLAATLVAAEKYEEAEGLYRESLRIQRLHFAEDSWQVATTQSLLSDCFIKWGRYEDAEPLAVQSFEIIRAEFGDQHGRTRAALGRVIAVYEGLGDTEKAAQYRTLLESAVVP